MINKNLFVFVSLENKLPDYGWKKVKNKSRTTQKINWPLKSFPWDTEYCYYNFLQSSLHVAPNLELCNTDSNFAVLYFSAVQPPKSQKTSHHSPKNVLLFPVHLMRASCSGMNFLSVHFIESTPADISYSRHFIYIYECCIKTLLPFIYLFVKLS